MSEPTRPHCYRLAPITLTLDGDSFKLSLNITPDTDRRYYCRLRGYDTPEKRRPASAYEMRMSFLALEHTRAFLTGPGVVWCHLTGNQTLGRELVDVWHEVAGSEGPIRTDLGESLLDAGLATRWPQRWHEVWDVNRDRL